MNIFCNFSFYGYNICVNFLMIANFVGRKFLMPVGRHHLKFKFQLPYNMLPSSYEGGMNCYVRYTLTATMIRPWAVDYVTTKAFTILEKIDLNVPELMVRKMPALAQCIFY